jgi:FKBP-type peptidyl-prolyl cis-trans isomerase
MSDIFISYAKADRSRAKEVATRLEQEGWSVFWDRNIPIGSTWDEILEQEISTMKVMVVLWSRASVASEWVRIEAEEGASRKILVSVFLEDVLLPLRFRAKQAVDISDWVSFQHDTLGVSQLIDAIARIGHLLLSNEAKAYKEKEQEEERSKREEVEKQKKEAVNKKKEEGNLTKKKILNYKNKWVWIIIGITIILSAAIYILIRYSLSEEKYLIRGADKFDYNDYVGATYNLNSTETLRIQNYLKENNITPTNILPNGLIYIEIQAGKGPKPIEGKNVKVNFTIELLDGTVIDSSIKKGQPYEFALGRGVVIEGFDLGIALMNEGGKATLIIPSTLAYKDKGTGNVIAPYTTLIINVELIETQTKK